MAREGSYLPPHRRGRIFDESKTLYARQRLQSRDIVWEIGEEVDWRAEGISVATVQQWFRIRYVSHFKNGDTSPEAREFYASIPHYVQAAPPVKSTLKPTKPAAKSRW